MKDTAGCRQKSVGGILSRGVSIVIILLSLAGCSPAQEMSAHHHAETGLNPDPMQDCAKARCAKSPRHQEWVKIKNGNREVNSFIVFPEVKTKATSVVVIHEIFGMSDWVQSLTDQLAEAGYVAIAPDLLSGMGPNGGGTSEIRAADSNAVGKTIRDLPAANGKIAVTGYCWGGTQSFRYATNNPKLKAAFVFYGSAPESKDDLARI